MNLQPIHTVLVNDKVRFDAKADGRHVIQGDYFPPVGDNDGYTGLELFLVSLSVCAATAIVSLVRQMRRTVTAFEADADGDRRDTHPTCFSVIRLRFTLTSPDATEEDFAKAVRLSEETICPVWAMIKGNVEVQTELVLKKD